MRKPRDVDSFVRRGRDAFINLTGLAAPAIGAIVAIPILLHELSTEAFALLTMYWVVIGYSNVFEFGMGRAVTRELASLDGDDVSSNSIISTALCTGLALGALAGVFLGFLLPVLFDRFLSIPQGLAESNAKSLIWISVCAPVLVLSSILIGVLEAQRKFAVIALVRIPTGVSFFIVPAIISLYNNNLSHLVASIVLVRVVLLISLYLVVLFNQHVRRLQIRFDVAKARDLLSFGGWLAVSALIGPLLVYMDRFMLSYYHGLPAVTVYTPPFEIVIRFLIVPTAIIGVMFPRFVAAGSGYALLKKIFLEANFLVFAIILPVALIFTFFGDAVFTVWLGASGVPSMAIDESAKIAAILAAGLLINALAHVPQAQVQASGRARWTGLLHIVEMGAFCVYAPILISQYAGIGAAAAWVARSTLSALALYGLSTYLFLRVKKDASFEYEQRS